MLSQKKYAKVGFGYLVMTMGKLTQIELTPDPLEL